jgi:PAS domain S-box-containing protein
MPGSSDPSRTRQNSLAWYALGVALATAAAAARIALVPELGARSPYTLFYPVILVVAWFGGLGPAIAAAAASVLVSPLLFAPVGGFSLGDAADRAGLVLFALVAACLIGATELARRARSAAKAEVSRSREILDRLSAGFVILGFDWRYIFINPEAERLLGKPGIDLVGQDARQAFTLAPEILDAMRAALERREASEFEIYSPRVNRWFLDRVFPVPDGAAVFFVDITDRVNAEGDRRLLSSIVASSDDAIISKDLHGRILSWNAAAERMYGYSAAEAIGKPVSSIIPPERADETFEFLDRIRRGECVEHHETQRRHRDGRVFEVALTVSPIYDQAGHIVGASKIARDISARKAAERERQRTRELFLGIMGHDLRNPLNTIAASIFSLEKNAGDPVRRVAGRMSRAAQRMTRMIDQLLDFTRARLGEGIPVQRQAADLREICSAVVEEFDAQQPSRVHLTADGAAPGLWDPDRMAQVLSNLLGNALAHGSSEHPVEVRMSSGGGIVRVEVANRGSPIPESDRRTIFEPFRRTHASAAQDSSGLGLGLYIAREIVRAHRGSIEVTSNESGTRFVVELPVVADTDTQQPN